MAADRLLLIDDDVDCCEDLALLLRGRFEVALAHDGAEALARWPQPAPDVVLLDVDFGPGRPGGLEVLERMLGREGCPPVIMLSGRQDPATVVQAVKMGAFHYLAKPADPDELVNLIERALAARRGRLHLQAHRGEVERLTGRIVAGDERTLRLLEKVEAAAATDATVLITGESGTGKEMIARRLHARSARAEGPFVGLNCGAVPAETIEAEIFGHVRGAFTGAERLRVGKFELAAGGTLFLDEIGDASLPFQVKLLRVLEERVFSRLGENQELRADCRIVAATSQDLEAALAAGGFRSELFYRLNIYRIHLPPLRQRPGDILPLAEHFLRQAAAGYRKEIEGFSPAVGGRLLEHPWPGNVRQLRNEVERAVINCSGRLVGLGDLFGDAAGPEAGSDLPYDEAKEQVLRQWQLRYLTARLQASGGNVTEAAERSGLRRQSFQRLMRELSLSGDEFQD